MGPCARGIAGIHPQEDLANKGFLDSRGAGRRMLGGQFAVLGGQFPQTSRGPKTRTGEDGMADVSARELGSLRTKLFYGLGSVAYGVKDQGFTTLLMLFYNQIVGLPAQWVGSAILGALAFDAVADPIVGQVSDNLRSRWGRRHPFMYAAALPVAISYWFLWNPPRWSNEALFVYLIIMAIVVRTFITFYEIPSSALAAELTSDYDERTSFMAYRFFFGWLGGLGMTILGFAVFFKTDASHAVGQLNPVGYSAYAFWAAVVMLGAILVSAAGTHKFIPYFCVPAKRRIGIFAMTREVFETWSHRSFAALTASTLFSSAATGVLFALNVYFSTYFWRLSAQQIATINIVLVIAPFLALGAATPLSRRFDKKRATVALFVGCLIAYCAPLVLGVAGILPKAPLDHGDRRSDRLRTGDNHAGYCLRDHGRLHDDRRGGGQPDSHWTAVGRRVLRSD